MFSLKTLALVVSFTMVVPAFGSAQVYESDKSTKEADKNIGLAMLGRDLAARQEFYRKALGALAPAMAANSNNAKVWFTAGRAHLGLDQYLAADSAFDRAVALSAAVAADVEIERTSGWLQAFTASGKVMDQGNLDQALAMLLDAEALYDKRPEGSLNIASIYSTLGNAQKAEEFFRKAASRAQGDLYASQDTTIQRTWRSYVELATLNIAQSRSAAGNIAFASKQFDTAAAAYKAALEINPFSRDYLMNYVQARYSTVIELEDALKADPTKLAASKPVLLKLYAELQTEIPKVRVYDPTNMNMLLILSDVVRHEGELNGNAQVARKRAFAMEQSADSMPVEVTDLTVQRSDTDVTIVGKIKNKTLAPSTPVTLKITLLGTKGESIGELTTTVQLTARGSEAEFKQKAPITALVAGWKYEVK